MVDFNKQEKPSHPLDVLIAMVGTEEDGCPGLDQALAMSHKHYYAIRMLAGALELMLRTTAVIADGHPRISQESLSALDAAGTVLEKISSDYGITESEAESE